jgi:hypothetical protein
VWRGDRSSQSKDDAAFRRKARFTGIIIILC